MIHIDPDNTMSNDLNELKWVYRDIKNKGSPSPMSRTGGFTSQSQYDKRSKTPLLNDRDSMFEVKPRKITMDDIEKMEEKAR